jgi:riboflavin synthase
MFTGLVEEIGILKKIVEILMGKRFFIAAHTVMHNMKIGDSIAVNGTCLTVTEFNADGFWVEVVAETLRCTNLGFLTVGSPLNLEASLTLQKAMGGHLLQGHVDGTGKILSIDHEGEAWLLKISYPTKLRPYLVNKGFIAMDGMSLTVIEVTDDYFSLTLIPHTQKVTVAGQYQVGSLVNLESDIMARYAENFWKLRHL